jgi:hypothetical protein
VIYKFGSRKIEHSVSDDLIQTPNEDEDGNVDWPYFSFAGNAVL